MGLAVTLCTLPWLGFVPDDLLGLPQAALIRLSGQVAVHPGMLERYVQATVKRPQTRSDHLKLVMKYLKWKNPSPGSPQLKELEQFLLDRAMEHDTPSLLFQQGVEHLISAQVTRPGVVTLMELVAAARSGAGALTSEKVEDLLTPSMRADLERMSAVGASGARASGTGVPGRHGWPGPRSAGVGTRRSLASRGTLVKRPVW